MRLLPLFLTFSLLSTGTTLADPVQTPAKSQRYCNAKFDYCLSVPAFLKPVEGEPDPSGQVFVSEDMFTQIHVVGSLNVYQQTLEKWYQAELKLKKYTFHRREKDAVVLAWKEENGQLVYQKTVLEKGRIRTVIFLYPQFRKAEIEKLIPEVLKTFVGDQSPAWAGLWKFSEKDPKQSHYLLLKGSEANPKGIYTGSESDEYLFYIKVGVTQLQISPEGQIRFKLGPRYLFQTPQNPKTPPNIKAPLNAGMTGVEWIYQGQIKGDTLKLNCKVGDKGIPGIDTCWLPEMTFVRVKS
jgi:hypothetical protein